MPLNYWTTAAGVKDSVEPVVMYLNAIGIKCKVTGIEGPSWFQNIQKAHSDPTAVWVHFGGPTIAHNADPVVGLNMLFYSKNPVVLYNNPQVDALIDQAVTTVDDTKRGELIKQGYRLINEDMPMIQLITTVTVYSMKTNVDYTPTREHTPMLRIKNINIR
jgi:ABC-type transport system substrate-binding protein